MLAQRPQVADNSRMIERIGVVGGGQLGRMLTQAAIPLGFEVMVVDPNEHCPAKQVGAEQIQASLTNENAIEDLAAQTDVLTWEIEHIPAEFLVELADSGENIEPDPRTLLMIQDKLTQKAFLREHGIPVAPFADLSDADFELDGGKGYVVKSRRGGYDGRSNLVLDELDDALIGQKFGDEAAYVEERLPFTRELAVVAARDKFGNIQAYKVVETIHRDNICHEVLVPAEVTPKVSQQAQDIAHETLKHLGGAGIFAIEMFQVDEGRDSTVYVNEIAPRVHNSGHWTIEGSHTSQFEQHIRAVAGLPLGDPTVYDRSPAAVMINVLARHEGPLTREGLDKTLALPNVHVHFYGKNPRPQRKIGHITVTGASVKAARKIAEQAREELVV